VICTPGELKCIGADLYVCNATGTSWTLKQKNSPTCTTSGQVPDFWTDPVGWVIAVITQAWEAMLGFVSGQFNIFLANVKNFTINYMTQLVAFIRDPVTTLRSWLDTAYATISAITGQITKGISDWWTTAQTTVKGWVDTAVKSANDFIKNFPSLLSDWWKSTSSSVGAWIDSAVKSANDWIKNFPATISSWWSSTVSSVQGWIAGAVTSLQSWTNGLIAGVKDALASASTAITNAWSSAVDGLSSWFSSAINDINDFLGGIWDTIGDLIDNAVAGVKDYIGDFVPNLVSGMFEWAKPLVDPLMKAADWLGSIGELITGKKPEDEKIQETRDSVKQHQDAVRELIKRL